MSKVNKFDHEVFGKLDVVVYEDKPYFVANDVVSITGQKNKSETLKYHCKSMIKLNYSKMLELGMEAKPKGIQLIPEKDVYRLIMNSAMANAEDFQDWVMEEVLPTIRKTGGFVSDVDQIMETFYKNESDENGGQDVLKGFIKQQQECLLEIQEEFKTTLQLALKEKDEKSNDY